LIQFSSRNAPGSPDPGLGNNLFNINQPDISYVKTTGQPDMLITVVWPKICKGMAQSLLSYYYNFLDGLYHILRLVHHLQNIYVIR